ncbi:MAG: hypothetical protein ACI9N9_002053 [Enterobacterales bacterium]|jgi:hypothetical protein
MNGRVYDYNLGRFLSVDPFIQDPGNSQSMNPYSYIMNNPLSGTDPSGYRARSAGSRTIWSRGDNDSISIKVALKNGKDDIIIKTTAKKLNEDVSQLEGVETSAIDKISIASNYISITHKTGGTDYAWLSRVKRNGGADSFMDNIHPNSLLAQNGATQEDFEKAEIRQSNTTTCGKVVLSCVANDLYDKNYKNFDDKDWLGRRSPIIISHYKCKNSCTGKTDLIEGAFKVAPYFSWFEDQNTLTLEGVTIYTKEVWTVNGWKTRRDGSPVIRSFNPETSRSKELRDWAKDQKK